MHTQTNHPPKKPDCQQGFVLLDLLSGLSCQLLLVCLAVAAGSHRLAHWQAYTQLTTLHCQLQAARLLALSRQSPIGLCGSDDGSTCQASWHRGYRLSPHPREDISPIPALPSWYLPTDQSWHFNHGRSLVFSAQGGATGGQGTFVSTVEQNGRAMNAQLVVNTQGRIRLQSHRS